MFFYVHVAAFPIRSTHLQLFVVKSDDAAKLEAEEHV